MELYYKFQPVTWDIGVIEEKSERVAHAIQPLYAPTERLLHVTHKFCSIDDAMLLMQPLELADKFLMVETNDGRTALFTNAFFPLVEQPTWHAARELDVPAYYICNEPTTISPDQKTGRYGGRIIELRDPESPYGQEPTFRIAVINDAGKWCFERYGKKQHFEEEQAYKALRKANRFTVEMLMRYCQALKIPIYDRKWYSDKIIIIQRLPLPGGKGFTYEEAQQELRI